MKGLSLPAALSLLLLLSATSALAQATQPAIALSVGTEEGKKMVHAVVTVAGKPVENVVLQYFVVRTFGQLPIGEDTTLDDGTSAVLFPSTLPGGADGKLHFTVKIKTPAAYGGTSATAEFAADCLTADVKPYPRALWAPNAPIPLVVCVLVLLAGVWGCYFFVVGCILAIRKEAKG